jgi:hypothetical protein
MDDYDNEDSYERGNAWTTLEDEPDEEDEDDGQLPFDFGDRRGA